MGERARHARGVAEHLRVLPGHVERDDPAERRAEHPRLPRRVEHAEAAVHLGPDLLDHRPRIGLVSRLRVLAHAVAASRSPRSPRGPPRSSCRGASGLADAATRAPGTPPRGRTGSCRPACRRRGSGAAGSPRSREGGRRAAGACARGSRSRARSPARRTRSRTPRSTGRRRATSSVVMSSEQVRAHRPARAASRPPSGRP